MRSGQTALLPAPLNAVPDLTGVGSKSFVEKVKEKLGIRAIGRGVVETEAGYELKEHLSPSF